MTLLITPENVVAARTRLQSQQPIRLAVMIPCKGELVHTAHTPWCNDAECPCHNNKPRTCTAHAAKPGTFASIAADIAEIQRRRLANGQFGAWHRWHHTEQREQL